MTERIWTHLGFRTKLDLEKHVRALVDRYPNRTSLNTPDLSFVVSLLSNHCEWVEKCGAGLAHIHIAPPPMYPQQRCFWIVRADGSHIDISWRHALLPLHAQLSRSDGTSSFGGADVRCAARLAIEPQMRSARRAQRSGSCWVCGSMFAKVGRLARTDVDHHTTSFEQLLRDWLGLIGGAQNVPLRDEGTHTVMTDQVQCADWQEYHLMWADLRLVHESCHKKITALRTKGWT